MRTDSAAWATRLPLSARSWRNAASDRPPDPTTTTTPTACRAVGPCHIMPVRGRIHAQHRPNAVISPRVDHEQGNEQATAYGAEGPSQAGDAADRSAFLKGFEVSRDVVAGGVAGGLCAGARRQRSWGQGRPEAAPSGVGLDAGEQRRSVGAQPRAAGLGSVPRTRVLDDLRTGSSAAEAFLRPTVVGMVRSGTTTTGSSSSPTTPPVAGIMPITSSRRAVSEPAHAAVAGVWRQRISPSRSP